MSGQSLPEGIRPGLSRTVSSMRLACAVAAMKRAVTLDGVVAAKDAAKAQGLMPCDMDELRTEFERNVQRFLK